MRELCSERDAGSLIGGAEANCHVLERVTRHQTVRGLSELRASGLMSTKK